MNAPESWDAANFSVQAATEARTEFAGASELAEAVALAAAVFVASGGTTALQVMRMVDDNVVAWVGRPDV